MIVAFIQAHMSSTRLPGKVLLPIAGRPMLWHVWWRLSQAEALDNVVVVTGDRSSDDPIVRFCAQNDIPCFRGSEDDLLDRYYQAAKAYGADVVVRITADCPLIDPQVVDEVIGVFLKGGYDCVCTNAPPTFPDGVGAEVFSFEALERAWREAEWQSEREHVTPYIRKHPELFRIGNVTHGEDLSSMRWTVDEPQDLEFVRAVYEHLESMSFGMADVLDVLKRHPELMEINVGVGRNEGYQKSVREDRLAEPKQ